MQEKEKFANLPTKIEKLQRYFEKSGKNIYIKRDDLTGTEFSGNKVRKLEYSFCEGLKEGAEIFITCGGIQSNHARAVAALAAKIGKKSVLLLRSDEKNPELDGNYFFNKVLGADIRLISTEEFSSSRDKIMENIKKEMEEKGKKAYIIPLGASNGIGVFGYRNCLREILEQEKELGIEFDTIVTAVGSGGTYAGLFLENKIKNLNKRIVGINVSDTAGYFKEVIYNIIFENLNYTNEKIEITKDEIEIIDGYVGRGYALSTDKELKFIESFARSEGIILDPVYTGKAMLGLKEELDSKFKNSKNILFIHTGGLFGIFPKKDEFVV